MTRAFLSGMWIHVVMFSRNPFDLSGVILWPILYASIAYYLLDAKNDPELLFSASLGAAVMAMWSLVVNGSAGALEQQRWLGTLELLVAAPVPFATVIAPISVANGFVGAYSLLATLAWGTLLFDVPLSIDQPFAFAVAVPVSVLAIGMLGLVIASTFILYRAAFHLGVAMQYPVWIATGLLVPLSVLPDIVGNVSWFLAPTWGFRALRESSLGGTPLASLLASPANRLALFLGRAVPSIATGMVTASITFGICAWILDVDFAASELWRIGVAALAASFACTAFGLCLGSLGFRGRNVSLFADMVTGSMLLLSGANVPLERLPGWVQAVSNVLPLTHGIEAARRLGDGETLGDVAGLLGTELAIGSVYLVLGVALLRFFEYEGRRSATLEAF